MLQILFNVFYKLLSLLVFNVFKLLSLSIGFDVCVWGWVEGGVDLSACQVMGTLHLHSALHLLTVNAINFSYNS